MGDLISYYTVNLLHNYLETNLIIPLKQNKILVFIHIKDEKYKNQGYHINFALKVTSNSLVMRSLSKIETAATRAPSVVKTMNYEIRQIIMLLQLLMYQSKSGKLQYKKIQLTGPSNVWYGPIINPNNLKSHNGNLIRVKGSYILFERIPPTQLSWNQSYNSTKIE